MATTKASRGVLNDGFISVLEKGAKGDGVTDDTAAIQAALTASHSVYLPAGTYKISSDLEFSAGQILHGDGPNSSYLVNAGTTDGITIDGVNYAELRGFTLTGSGTSGHGVNIKGTSSPSSRIRFFDVNIRSHSNAGKAAIRMANCFNISGFGVSIDNGNYHGILTEGTGGDVNAVRFYGGEIVDGTDIAVVRGPGFQFSLNGVTVENNAGGGIDIANAAASGTFDTVGFSDCYFDANGTFHIRAGDGSTPAVRNLRVAGNYFGGSINNVELDKTIAAFVGQNRHNVGGGAFALKTSADTRKTLFMWQEYDGAVISDAAPDTMLLTDNRFEKLPQLSPVALEQPSILTIVDGVTTITSANSYIRITSTGAAATSNATAIADPASGSQILVIENVGASTITIRNAANTKLAGAADVNLGTNDTLTVIFDGGDWVQIGSSNN